MGIFSKKKNYGKLINNIADIFRSNKQRYEKLTLDIESDNIHERENNAFTNGAYVIDEKNVTQDSTTRQDIIEHLIIEAKKSNEIVEAKYNKKKLNFDIDEATKDHKQAVAQLQKDRKGYINYGGVRTTIPYDIQRSEEQVKTTATTLRDLKEKKVAKSDSTIPKTNTVTNKLYDATVNPKNRSTEITQ
jgi:hypothetical protein